jgi:hypothetical protein
MLRSFALQKFSKHGRLARRLSSFVQGSSEPPLVNATLSHFYETEVLEKYAARPALVSLHEPQNVGSFESRHLKWSYADMWSSVNALARGLIGIGVKKGDRVGIVMGNNRCLSFIAHRILLTLSTSAYVSLQWACASIGAILVTLNPVYRIHELVSNRCSYDASLMIKLQITTLNIVSASHLFIVPSMRSSNYLQLFVEKCPSLAHSLPGEMQSEELPHLKVCL